MLRYVNLQNFKIGLLCLEEDSQENIAFRLPQRR